MDGAGGAGGGSSGGQVSPSDTSNGTPGSHQTQGGG